MTSRRRNRLLRLDPYVWIRSDLLRPDAIAGVTGDNLTNSFKCMDVAILESGAVGVWARERQGGGKGDATELAVDWPNGIKVGSSGAVNWLLPAAHIRVI